MEVDATREFEIDKTLKPNCPLAKDVQGNAIITIQKKLDNTYVPPSLRKRIRYQFVMSERDAWASIRCHSGKVPMLKVSPKARDCGIGKILMQLCLNEEKIHNVDDNDNNLALLELNHLSLIFRLGQEMESWVKSKCERILYLQMVANPKKAAHVYFKSAFDSGYTEMFVALDEEFYPREGPCSVMALKERYTDDGYMKDNDGTPIDGTVGDDTFNVFGKEWFFCKLKVPKPEPKPNPKKVKCTEL